MTHTKNNRWFIFYQDQLLLEKKNNAFSIPSGESAPIAIPEGTTVHTLTTPDGISGKSFYIDSPITETPELYKWGCALLMITCRSNTIKQQVKLTKSCTGTVATAFAPHVELHWYRKSLL